MEGFAAAGEMIAAAMVAARVEAAPVDGEAWAFCFVKNDLFCAACATAASCFPACTEFLCLFDAEPALEPLGRGILKANICL